MECDVGTGYRRSVRPSPTGIVCIRHVSRITEPPACHRPASFSHPLPPPRPFFLPLLPPLHAPRCTALSPLSPSSSRTIPRASSLPPCIFVSVYFFQGDRLVSSPPAYTSDLSALPATLDGAKRLTEVLQASEFGVNSEYLRNNFGVDSN